MCIRDSPQGEYCSRFLLYPESFAAPPDKKSEWLHMFCKLLPPFQQTFLYTFPCSSFFAYINLLYLSKMIICPSQSIQIKADLSDFRYFYFLGKPPKNIIKFGEMGLLDNNQLFSISLKAFWGNLEKQN